MRCAFPPHSSLFYLAQQSIAWLMVKVAGIPGPILAAFTGLLGIGLLVGTGRCCLSRRKAGLLCDDLIRTIRLPAIPVRRPEEIMRQRKTMTILLGVLIGIVAAAIASSLIRVALQANDPSYQCATNYLATHEFRIGDKPMSVQLAKIIARQCQEQIARLAVIDRFDRVHPVAGPLMRTVVPLFDPITLALAVVFSFLVSFFLLRVFRRAPVAQG